MYAPTTCNRMPGHPMVKSWMVASMPPVSTSSPTAPISRELRTTPIRRSHDTFLKCCAVNPAIRASTASLKVITSSMGHAGIPVSRWFTKGAATAAISPTRQPNL